MNSKPVYKPYIQKEPEREDFPFTFKMVDLKVEDIKEYMKENEIDIEIDYIMNSPKEDPLKTKIKHALINKFPFHIYADKLVDTYNKTEDFNLVVKVNTYKIVKEGNKRVSKLVKQFIIDTHDFHTTYSFSLIRDIDTLKNVLKDVKKMSFDTETTGLNPEEDYIVGVNFAVTEREGYYAPVKHADQFEEFNLGEEALKIIYEAMLKATRVYMFNARFDMRMMEFNKVFYDMSKVKTIDTGVNYYLADPASKIDRLKDLEKHVLGYHRPDLSATLRSANINNFNFSNLHPEIALFYAAQDGITTYELGEVTMPYYYETKLSGQIDQALLVPLMRMENSGIRIDIEHLKRELNKIIPRLKELDDLVAESIGDVNLNSPKQKAALFESFGLDTGVKTKTGAMSTGGKAVDAMIERLNKLGEPYPEWLGYLGERSRLEKLNNTFFGSLYEQAKLYKDNRVRLNYRNTTTATGRLSSGRDDEG